MNLQPAPAIANEAMFQNLSSNSERRLDEEALSRLDDEAVRTILP
jgi:hypothetical protein